MIDAMGAAIPSQRWAGPSDSRWDIHFPSFELWVNEDHDPQTNTIAGFNLTYDEAIESDELMDFYVDMIEQARGEAQAERYYD